MEPQIWSDVAVDVQTTLAAAKTITAVSKADPGVVNIDEHGYQNGDFLLLRVRGMWDLDYAVVRATVVDADSIRLVGIDTSAFKDFVSGTAQEITFGASAGTITDVTPSGGEANQVQISTIHRRRAYSKPGEESPLQYQLGSLWVPDDPAVIEMQKASRKREVRAMRFTFSDGTLAVFAGAPSMSGAPGGAANAPVTSGISVAVRGLVQGYAAV